MNTQNEQKKLTPLKRVREHLQQATVEIVSTKGMGVYIEGGFILTRARSVKYSRKPAEQIGTGPTAEIRAAGKKFKLPVSFYDLVHDIALLKVRFLDADKDVSEFRQRTKPMELHIESLRPRGILVNILTTKQTWVRARATETLGGMVSLITEEAVDLGTSTTPILTKSGKLLALTSTFTTESRGIAPRPPLALPFWYYFSLPTPVIHDVVAEAWWGGARRNRPKRHDATPRLNPRPTANADIKNLPEPHIVEFPPNEAESDSPSTQ